MSESHTVHVERLPRGGRIVSLDPSGLGQQGQIAGTEVQGEAISVAEPRKVERPEQLEQTARTQERWCLEVVPR